MKIFQKEYIQATISVLVLAVCIFPHFYKLGDRHIWQWDEARYVNNAIEMLRNGNFWQVKMDGQTDFWNFKPPFALWWQVFSMRIFGISEWSVRLPSALAGAGVIALIFWYSHRVLRQPLVGWVAGLVLVGSVGWLRGHALRSADLDAVLAFLLTAQVLVFLHFVQLEKPNRWWVALLGGLTICAFLTKGLPGFFFLPWLAAISFLHGNAGKIWRQPIFYVVGVAVFAAAAGYYFQAAQAAPDGYWAALKKSEFTRWSAESLPWHVHPWHFYLGNFWEERFPFFLPLLPATLFLPLLMPLSAMRRQAIYLLIAGFGYLFFISLPPVKLAWYDVPCYPIFALLIGLLVATVWLRLRNLSFWQKNPLVFSSLGAALLVGLLAIPFSKTLNTFDYDPEKAEDLEKEAAYLKILRREKPALLRYAVLKNVRHPSEHYDCLKFYKKAYAHHLGAEVRIAEQVANCAPGDTVVVRQWMMHDSLRQRFGLDTLHHWSDCFLLKIKN